MSFTLYQLFLIVGKKDDSVRSNVLAFVNDPIMRNRVRHFDGFWPHTALQDQFKFMALIGFSVIKSIKQMRSTINSPTD